MWVMKVTGASQQHITQEFECVNHGRFAATTPRDIDGIMCPECGELSPWVISAPLSYVSPFEVVRGGVAKQERPTWLSTRALAEGMSMKEWKAQRAKVDEEKRHKEAKEWDRFCKGSP